MLLAIVAMSCSPGSSLDDNPKLKESERIAVIMKAKTDTTSLFIQMDDKNYVVKEGAIIKAGRSNLPSVIGPIFFGAMVGAMFALLLSLIFDNNKY